MMNQVICGDCLEVMKDIPDKSIDLVLTDPPYGITACAWDAVIPFPEMWSMLLRVAKDDTPIIFTASQPFTSAIVMSNPTLFKHEWIYKKLCASNFAQAKYAPMKEHESVLIFGKAKVNYYPIKEERQGSGGDRVKHKFNITRSGEFTSIRDALPSPETERYPSSVQEFNNRAVGDRGLHPTQKPVELFRYFIETYSKDNDLILDPFLGSGTTAVVAYQLHRRYIGIEISPNYVKIAKKRLAQKMLF